MDITSVIPMKVFGIGFSRTGTTSLTEALSLLGFRALHYPSRRKQFDEYDALTDATVTARWRELDMQYPGAKFILTVREMESWIRSCQQWYLPERLRPWWAYVARYRCYGAFFYNEAKFRKAVVRHEREVKQYFQDRPNDLLVMDICGGDGWDTLCPFLNRPIPSVPFPRQHALATPVELSDPHTA